MPTGTMTFIVDGVAQSPSVPLSGGQASLALGLSAAGSPHTVVAQYNGDPNFMASSGQLPGGQAVLRANTSATLGVDINPAFFGQTVTLTANISAVAPGAGTPAGTAVFVIDGIGQTPVVPVVGGRATFSVSTLSVGTHSISVNYQGDANFNPTTASLIPPETVTKANTVVTVASDANPSVFGQAVTFTATVSTAGTAVPDGSVTFVIDGVAQSPAVPLVGGRASFTTSTLGVTANPHSVTVSYPGNANFNLSSGSLSGGQVVGQASTTTSVVTSNNSIIYGQSVTFTATVAAVAPGSGTPTGTVVFLVDGVAISGQVQLTNGQASFTTSGIHATAAPHTVSASYSGETRFKASQGSLSNQFVAKADTRLTLPSPRPTPPSGKTILFTATVTNTSTTPTPTGTVTFTVDGAPKNPITLDTSGRATLAVILTPGQHVLTASYNGAGDFNVSNASLTQLVVTPNQSFVYQVYRDLLGREADPHGLASWTSQLDHGATRQSVVGGILGSTEYLNRFLNGLYMQYFNRPIDPNGLSHWTQVLRNQTLYVGDQNAVEFVKAQLLGSLEYFLGHGGGTNAGFLNALYLDVLGRPIDPSAFANLSQQLAQGVSRVNVAKSVVTSLEARQRVVNGMYMQFLHRPADPRGLASFTNLLATSKDYNPVIIGLVSSEEYFNNL
jgi:hypothetical protein